MTKEAAPIGLMTRLEILVVAIIYIAGVYPPEVWPTSLYLFSGRNVGELAGFGLTLLGVSILYVTSMLLWADLFRKGLPGKFVSKIAGKVLSQEKDAGPKNFIMRLARKVGGFRNLYKATNLNRHQRFMRVVWMLMLGALPGGFTLFGILICASARYFRGIIPILLGFSVSIYVTTLGGVYAVDKIHGVVDASIDKLISIIPFAVSTSTIFVLILIIAFAIILHWAHMRQWRKKK